MSTLPRYRQRGHILQTRGVHDAMENLSEDLKELAPMYMNIISHRMRQSGCSEEEIATGVAIAKDCVPHLNKEFEDTYFHSIATQQIYLTGQRTADMDKTGESRTNLRHKMMKFINATKPEKIAKEGEINEMYKKNFGVYENAIKGSVPKITLDRFKRQLDQVERDLATNPDPTVKKHLEILQKTKPYILGAAEEYISHVHESIGDQINK